MKHIPVIAVIILMPAALYFAILSSPVEARLGESVRILYFHVPAAVCAVLSFLISAAAALSYLKREKPELETLFHFSAAAGLVFTVLTAVSGAIWAKIAWGSFWNWDPRETSIVFLMIIYLSYFVFSASLAGKKRTARLRAVYLLFSALPMPFFVFIMPRILPSLHPNTIINAQKTVHLSAEMRIALSVSILAFASLLTAVLSFKYRIAKIKGGRI